MKLQAIWFRTPVRFTRGRLLNNISLENKGQTDWQLDADYKSRIVSVTVPDDEVPWEIPFENIQSFRIKKQALVMKKVRDKG